LSLVGVHRIVVTREAGKSVIRMSTQLGAQHRPAAQTRARLKCREVSLGSEHVSAKGPRRKRERHRL